MNFLDMTIKVLSGTGATLLIFFTTLIISLPLGLPFMFLRMSKIKPIAWITTAIISILRGTPLMLQLIVWFFAPYYIFGIKLSVGWRILSVIIGFSVNYAAYFAEIYRGGLLGIPRGQYDAAFTLGYTKSQTFIRIILPQMIKRVVPSVTNEVICLVKDTSLAFVVSYIEVFTLAKQIAAAKTTVIPLFIAGGFYYVFNFIVEKVTFYIEKKLSYYEE